MPSPRAACASSAPTARASCRCGSRVWAAFGSVVDETDFRPGSVSCAFQSGGFGYGIVNLAEAQGLGFRYCVSSGNETDIDMPELLSAFLDDPGTSIAFAYLEGTPDARRLLDVGRKSLGDRQAGDDLEGRHHRRRHQGRRLAHRQHDRQRRPLPRRAAPGRPDRGGRRGAHRRHRQGVRPGAPAPRQPRGRAVDLGRLQHRLCRCGGEGRPDAAAVRRGDARRAAQGGAGVSARPRTPPT